MILVVGGTGVVGGAIARGLRAKGEDVKVLVREGSDYQGLVDAGCVPVFGDVKNPASLDVACEGVSTVISTANSAARGGDDNVETVDRQGNRNLIDAAAKAGVGQFVYISAQVADIDSPVPFFKAKAETEQHLVASGMPYTILAPNAFIDIWVHFVSGIPAMTTGKVTLTGEGKRIHSFVCGQDVAAFACNVVGRQEAMNQRFVIGGPAAFSFRDAAAVYGSALGKEIECDTVPIGEPVPGLPPFISEALMAFEFFDSPNDMADLAATFGVEMTPLETFVAGVVAS